MPTILGLDLSLTSTGYCVLHNKEIGIKGTIKPKNRGMKRLTYILEEISTITPFGSLDLVVIEGYSFGSRAGQAFSIGELGGFIKQWIYSTGTKTIIVPPQTLKKFVAGKGGFKKNMMMMKAFKKYGLEFNNDDECDAFCLAKMGEAYLNGTEIKYEQEALGKVEVLR